LEYRFDIDRHRRNDPNGLVPKHVEQVAYNWLYAREKWQEEIFTKDAQKWAQVLERKATRGLTIFKILSLDEQMEVIIQGNTKTIGKQKKIEELKRSN
jgi:hypothetical protein